MSRMNSKLIKKTHNVYKLQKFIQKVFQDFNKPTKIKIKSKSSRTRTYLNLNQVKRNNKLILIIWKVKSIKKPNLFFAKPILN